MDYRFVALLGETFLVGNSAIEKGSDFSDASNIDLFI